MFGNKGFTLLELMVAIALLAISFSVIFDLISKARLDSSNSGYLLENLIKLNNAIALKNTEKLQSESRALKDYPQIEEVIYKLGNAEIYIYRGIK